MGNAPADQSRPRAATCIYGLVSVFLLLLVAAVATPRLCGGSGNGFERVTAAALAFLTCAGLAGLTALTLFIVTLRWRRALPRAAVITGVLPLPVFVIGGVLFFVVLRY